LNESSIGETLVASGASEAVFVEFEWIFAIVALVNHEVFGPGGDGPLTIAQRTPLCEFLHITIGAIRRTILDAEPTFRQRLIASLAKEAVSMKGIAAVTDAALRTYDCLFAFGAFRRDVSGVAFVAVLFERIFGVVYEPLWPGDAIRANGASEAICVKLHILVLEQIDCAQNRLIASDTSSNRHFG